MKTIIKQFRIDEDLAKVIDKICKKENIKFSDFVRHCIDKDLFKRNLVD